MDVTALMAAINLMHRVSVSVLLMSGDTSGASMRVGITVARVGEDASVMGVPVLALSGEFPCKEHTTLQACVFAGLYRIDSEISRQLYKQSELEI